MSLPGTKSKNFVNDILGEDKKCFVNKSLSSAPASSTFALEYVELKERQRQRWRQRWRGWWWWSKLTAIFWYHHHRIYIIKVGKISPNQSAVRPHPVRSHFRQQATKWKSHDCFSWLYIYLFACLLHSTFLGGPLAQWLNFTNTVKIGCLRLTLRYTIISVYVAPVDRETVLLALFAGWESNNLNKK